MSNTIHIIYTGEARGPIVRLDDQGRSRHVLYNKPTICHVTASTGNPAEVTKDDSNPVFSGSGAAWNSGSGLCQYDDVP